jgi:hypothetical protein
MKISKIMTLGVMTPELLIAENVPTTYSRRVTNRTESPPNLLLKMDDLFAQMSDAIMSERRTLEIRAAPCPKSTKSNTWGVTNIATIEKEMKFDSNSLLLVSDFNLHPASQQYKLNMKLTEK